MSSTLTPLSDLERPRTYRWAWWTVLLNFASSIFILPGLTLLIITFRFLFLMTLRSGEMDYVTGVVLVFFCLMIAICGVFWILFLIYPLGRFIFSYLKVSHDGLEYHYWPTYGTRCAWEDIDRLGVYKTLGFISNDVLYLKRAEPVGRPITMTLRRKLGFKSQYFIPLTGIHGWPGGDLADQLRYFAPQLFTLDDSFNTKD